MSKCTNCGPTSSTYHSNTNNADRRFPAFKPSVTVERACFLVRNLLNNAGCDTECPDWELCRLLRFTCELHCGRFNLATLSLLTASRYLQSEALSYGRTGRFKTLTIDVQADRSADFLMSVAQEWKEEAMKTCNGMPKFGIVKTGRGCHVSYSHKRAYHSCGCYWYEPAKYDDFVLTDCRFDCCDTCVDEPNEITEQLNGPI